MSEHVLGVGRPRGEFIVLLDLRRDRARVSGMAATSKARPDPQKSLVGFVVGDVAYAVPIADVREIVNPLLLTELPHAPRRSRASPITAAT